VQQVELTPSVAFDTAPIMLFSCMCPVECTTLSFKDACCKDELGTGLVCLVGISVTDVARVWPLEVVTLATASLGCSFGKYVEKKVKYNMSMAAIET